MRSNKLFFVIVVCLFMTAGAAKAEDYLGGGKANEIFIRDLDYLYEMGKEIYCYWDLKKEMYGVDWDALYKDARSKMAEAKEINQYLAVMTEMIAAVKDGHVNVWPNLQSELSPYFMPLSFEEVEGRILIDDVDNSVFLGEPTVKHGDELLAVNGVGVGDIIKQISTYRSGSTPRMIRKRAIRWLDSWSPYAPPPASNPILTVRSHGEAQPHSAEVPWLIYDPESDPTYEKQLWKISQRIYARILPGNIGYLRLQTMYGKIEPKEFIRYVRGQMEYLLKTNGLIIDVRNNGGGWSGPGDLIISYLIDKPLVRARLSPRWSMATLIMAPGYFAEFESDPATNNEFAKWKDVTIEPVEESLRYHNKVVLLTDAGCFSACDQFADGLAANQLASIVGTGTGGGTGAPIEFQLPSGFATARFSITRGMSNFGHFLEGTGTIPNTSTEESFKDFLEGRDTVLVKAHQMLTKKNGATVDLSRSQGLMIETPLMKEGNPIIPAFIEDLERIRQSSHEFDMFAE